MDLSIVEVTSDTWNELIYANPAYNAFMCAKLHRYYPYTFKYYSVLDENRISQAYFYLTFRDGELVTQTPFLVYNDILFKETIKKRKNVQEKSNIIKFIMDYFRKSELEPQFDLIGNRSDLRAFAWYNFYSGHEYAHFMPRFTAILELNKLEPEVEYFKSLSKGRRAEIKRASNYKFKKLKDCTGFLDVYKKMFERQGTKVDTTEMMTIKTLMSGLIKDKKAKLFGIEINNEIVSFSFFIIQDKFAYYLFGANDAKFRSSGASSRLLYNSFVELRKSGIEYVDLLGANSPLRGGYKLSFKSELVTYMQFELRHSHL